MTRRAIILTLTLLITIALVTWRAKPHAVTSESFDAASALAAVRRVMPSNTPHPLGSAEHDAVRDRIVAELRARNLSVSVQRQFICSDYGSCATAQNIIALPQRVTPRIVMLVAHYDSVPAGPGGCDDGAGVAVLLEAANRLAADTSEKSIAYLFTDGEEGGLLGAWAFMRHPLSKQVDAVVNLDARGCSGPALMYEIAGDEQRILAAVSPHLRDVHTSSAFREVYKYLPNDTDFTVFRKHGIAGVNLAFTDGASFYHTAGDEPSRLDRRTLQQQGESAIRAIRALATAGDVKTNRVAIFFDLLGLGVFHWPASATALFVMIAAVLVTVATLLAIVAEGEALLLIGAALAPLGAALAAFSAGLFAAEPYLAAREWQWIAHPAPLFVAVVALAIAAALTITPRADALGSIAAGQSHFWAALTLLGFFLAPGFIYIALLPTVSASLAAIVAAQLRSETASVIACAIHSAVCVLTTMPLVLLFYPGLGVMACGVIGALIALLVSTVAPYVAVRGRTRRVILIVAALATVGGVGISLSVPTHDATAPDALLLTALHDRGETTLLARTRGNNLPAIGGHWVSADSRKFFPTLVQTGGLYSTSLPPLTLAEPQIETRASGTDAVQHWTLRARGTAGAARLAISLHSPGTISNVRVNGEALALSPRVRRMLAKEWIRVSNRTAAGEELVVTLDVGGGALSGYVDQQSFGLPAAAASVAPKRSAALLPTDDGDTTIVRRWFGPGAGAR